MNDEPHEPTVTPPEDKKRTKMLLMLLERALDISQRDALIAEASLSDAHLRKALMFVLQIPVGAGLQGASWNLKWCRNRYNLIVGKFLHPDKRMLYKHPTLLPRAADFDRAIQEFNNSWQKLEPLLEQSEGVYVAPAAAQGDEARGASGTPLPGTARRRQQ